MFHYPLRKLMIIAILKMLVVLRWQMLKSQRKIYFKMLLMKRRELQIIYVCREFVKQLLKFLIWEIYFLKSFWISNHMSYMWWIVSPLTGQTKNLTPRGSSSENSIDYKELKHASDLEERNTRISTRTWQSLWTTKYGR